MENSKNTKYKIIFIIIYFILILTAEFFYRDPLFDHSISIAKKLQDKLSFCKEPFKYYTYLGVLDFFWVFLVFLFFPISYCYTFFLNVILSVHLCNYIKLIYGDGRPFLINDKDAEKIRLVCESGYGNPSGHSFESTSIFLGFSQLIIDYWQLNITPSIFIYIIITILILLINLSRVVLGVHALNQVIYGDTLGFAIYFIIFQIIKPHKQDANKFFQTFLKIKYHILNTFLFIIVLTYIILGDTLFDRENDNKYEEYKQKLIKYCNTKENRMLNRDAIFKSLYITGYFGMTIGLTLLTKIIKKNYYSKFYDANNYHINTNKKWRIKYGYRFLFLSLSFIPYSTIFLKPNNINIKILYIIGSGFPMFIFGFFLFGPNIIFNILLNVANIELYMPILKNERINSEVNFGDDEMFDLY